MKTLLLIILLSLTACNSNEPALFEIISKNRIIEITPASSENIYNHSIAFKVNTETTRVYYQIQYNSVFFVPNAENFYRTITSDAVELIPTNGIYNVYAEIYDRSFQSHIWDTVITITAETINNKNTYQIIEYGQ